MLKQLSTLVLASGSVAALWLGVAACAATGDDGAGQAAPQDEALAERRRRMVEEQLRARDVKDERVLEAMRRVPRHLFVPADQRALAYEDYPLPIGHAQTISQPYIVALHDAGARAAAAHRVLEIGTGSGYQAAVLAELVDAGVLDRDRARAGRTGAAAPLAGGYRHVQVRTGNGYLGWPEAAPFDRIIVTAAPPEMPPALVAQLAVGGRMVIPVGDAYQEIRIVSKTAAGIVEATNDPRPFRADDWKAWRLRRRRRPAAGRADRRTPVYMPC